MKSGFVKPELMEAVADLRARLLGADDGWAPSIRTGDWRTGLGLLEALLSAPAHDRRVKFWWMQAQIEAGQMPLAALTAPLDELVQELGARYRPLAFVTLLAFGLKLIGRDQLRLALIQLENAERFLSDECEMTARQSRAFHRLLIDLLEEEIRRAESRREKRAVIEKFTRRLEERRRLSEQEMVEEVAAPPSEGTVDIVSEPPRRKWHQLAVGGAVLALIGLLLLRQGESVDIESLLLMASSGETTRELFLPQLPVKYGRSGSPSVFESVTKRLEEGGKRQPNRSSEESRGEATAEEKQVSAPPDTAATKADESSPHYYDPEPITPKTPELDTAKVAAHVLESLDNLEGRSASTGVGRDGRPYGSPLGGEGSSMALDGSPLRAYEVETFERPMLYKTIAATNVLSAPSVLATAVARLDQDATIQVVSRMGKWLEVRSSGGRRGYIFSQNAVAFGDVGARPQ